MSELAKWDSFYVVVGSAAGALIGLQFVVATLIAERPALRVAEAGAAFATPTIVHFGTALLLTALTTGSVAVVHCSRSSLGTGGHQWSSIRGDRGSANAAAKHISTGPRGLAVLCRAAFGGVRTTRAVAIRRSQPHARGPVLRRICSTAAAFRRHSQCLGHHRLSCVCQKGGYKRLAGRFNANALICPRLRSSPLMEALL